jgi:LacI family transcriptional regulator
MGSLKRIASDVGVSYTLVSKVLSGRLSTTGVSEKTREAILKRARELDYTPNRLAVALKAGRKGAVGIFVHQHGSPGSDVSDRLLQGLSDGLELSGLRMWLRFFKTKDEFVAACGSKLQSEVDGLIVAGVDHPELLPKFLELEKKKVPVVSIFQDKEVGVKPRPNNVTVDMELQGYLPTKHLLDLGLRRIVCTQSIASRTAGFLRAMREAGVAVDPKLQLHLGENFLGEGARDGIRRFLAEGLSFDGVVCQSDAQAVGVINELVGQGIRVPEQVKVTGADNSPMAHYCIVPITSVSSEMRVAGKRAVEMLLGRIKGESGSSILIPPRLIRRESA